MIVRELMTSVVYFVKVEGTVEDAIALMQQNNVGMVPVCDKLGSLTGIVTDRDLLLNASLSEWNLYPSSPITSVMNPDVITLSPDMDIHEAACVFSKHKKRRLPVMENSKVIGVLSITDLAKKRIFLAEVGEIMGALTT